VPVLLAQLGAALAPGAPLAIAVPLKATHSWRVCANIKEWLIELGLGSSSDAEANPRDGQ
jgi:hypothetical protein